MYQRASETGIKPLADGRSSLAVDDGASRMVMDLQHAIETGALPFGSRLRPLREMATQYGISVPTAQRVTARLESLGLVRRRQGAGVFVAYREPQDAATDAVAIMLLGHHDPVFDRFAARLAEGLTQLGISPMRPAWTSRQGQVPVQQWLNIWRKHPPRLVAMQQSIPALTDAIDATCAGRSLLVEVFHVPATATSFHRVNPDYAGACRAAVEYLLARGHRRIGFTTHRRRVDCPQDPRFRKRWSGHTYQMLEIGRALRDAGIQKHGLAIHYNHSVPTTDTTVALHPLNVKRAKAWLSQPDRPTAVFGDDNRIAGIVRAAEQLGMRLGEDLDVIGQGNTDWSAAMDFPSIDLQPELVAEEVMELVRRHEAGTLHSRHDIAVPVRVVDRWAAKPARI